MITESFYNYKGYTIRLRASTFNGFWYAIIKEIPNINSPNGIKKLYLRQRGWNFIKSDILLNKAKNYPLLRLNAEYKETTSIKTR